MYAPEVTNTSKSALLQLAIHLKPYHDQIVLTGGWAPYFITEKTPFEHCGSVDIDLVLKTDIKTGDRYETIRKIIEGLGYKPETDFRFSRYIPSLDGTPYKIVLDLLCDSEGAQYITPQRKVQEDLRACVFDGLNIAFDFNFEQEIEGFLPENGEDKATIKVADLVSSLALKGKALGGRGKAKDAYDIFALTHCGGGALQAAQYFNELVAHKELAPTRKELLKSSVAQIADKFKHEDMRGPFDVWRFSDELYERNIVAAQVNLFLSNITLE